MYMLLYIMQIHINLSKYYVSMCKPQTDQWDKWKSEYDFGKGEKKEIVLIPMQE